MLKPSWSALSYKFVMKAPDIVKNIRLEKSCILVKSLFLRYDFAQLKV